MTTNTTGGFYDNRLHEMRQETEYYRQQLELEHLRQQLSTLRGNATKQVLPRIGMTSQWENNQTTVPLQQQQNIPQISAPFHNQGVIMNCL